MLCSLRCKSRHFDHTIAPSRQSWLWTSACKGSYRSIKNRLELLYRYSLGRFAGGLVSWFCAGRPVVSGWTLHRLSLGSSCLTVSLMWLHPARLTCPGNQIIRPEEDREGYWRTRRRVRGQKCQERRTGLVIGTDRRYEADTRTW